MSTQYTDSHAVPTQGEYIEITFSPPDHMQYMDLSFYDRFMTFRAYWLDRIKKHLDGYQDYLITIEQSLQGQRYHLHGLIKVNKIQRLIHSLGQIRLGPYSRKKYHQEVISAVYKIKDQDHYKERYAYITKDIPTFQQEELNPIIAPKNGSMKPPKV